MMTPPGIENATMIGWWEDVEQGNGTVPVRCDQASLKTTVYLKHGEAAMIVLADWNEAAESVDCTLRFDWKALGLSEATAKLHAPEITPFQLGEAVKEYTVGETLSINVTAGGLLLLLEGGQAH